MVKHIELFFKEGSSDKVYKASIVEEDSGFLVNFSYGRRGNALTNGTKTPKPVSLEQAEKIYNKLIQEKTSKGYQEDPEGKPFSGTVTEARDTGIRPQLLNEIEEEEIEKYLSDPDWCAQEKFDGRRRLLINVGDKVGNVLGTNRKGLTLPISGDIAEEVKLLLGMQGGVLDGEDMGDHIVIFDLIKPGLTYAERHLNLQTLFKMGDFKILRPIFTAITTKDKRALYKKLQKDNAEGIVFKNMKAVYKPGRPNSGGDQLKFKFCATATCIVGKVNNTKRSISINVFDDNLDPVNVGNVTVYPNQDIPEPGSIVEVKYLYYFPGGSLFQPVLLGKRDDMEPDDCTLKQLKIKREEVES